MANETGSMSYIARCKCGCGGIKAAIMDHGFAKRDTARETGKWIRDGYAVERITTQSAREQSWGCPLEKAAREAKAQNPAVAGAQMSLGVE